MFDNSIFSPTHTTQAREAEGRANALAKELQAAREHVLELDKKQYEG